MEILVNRTSITKKNVINELVGIFICLLITTLVFGIEFAVWNKNFSIPYFIVGDSVGVNKYIMNAVNGESPWCVLRNVQYPFGGRNSAYSDGILNILYCVFLGKITGNVGYSNWLYYFSTYFIVSFLTYLSLRMVNLGILTSCVGGIIYAFLPLHYYRLGHVNLNNYIYVPVILSFCLLVYMWHQSMYKWRQLPLKYKLWFGVICFAGIVAGMSSIYYALMCISAVTVAEIICVMRFRSVKSTIFSGIVVGCIILGIVNTILIEQIYSEKVAKSVENIEWIDEISVDEVQNEGQISHFSDGSRKPDGVPACSLHPYVMFLPIMGDRIDGLYEWSSNTYNEVDGENADTYISSVGVIVAAGIVAAFIIFLCRREKEAIREMGAKMVVILTLCFMSYGFVTFLGFVNPGVRSWNRINLLIAYFALAIILKIVEDKSYNLKYKWQRTVVMGSVLILALGSQISPDTQKYMQCCYYHVLPEREVQVSSYEQYEQLLNSLKRFCEEVRNLGVKQVAYWNTESTYMQFWTRLYGNDLQSNACEDSYDTSYAQFWEWVEGKDVYNRTLIMAYLGYDMVLIEDSAENFDMDYKELCHLLGEPTIKIIPENKSLKFSDSKMLYAFDLTAIKVVLNIEEPDNLEAKERFYEVYGIYKAEQKKS